uniref:Putative secreted protein n=1 Tax=Anopheles darlingi TaxID=43151 RepID=A0A2M4DNH6_ANODA
MALVLLLLLLLLLTRSTLFVDPTIMQHPVRRQVLRILVMLDAAKHRALHIRILLDAPPFRARAGQGLL